MNPVGTGDYAPGDCGARTTGGTGLAWVCVRPPHSSPAYGEMVAPMRPGQDSVPVAEQHYYVRDPGNDAP